jgi:organic radical activating enzyme
MSNHLILSRDLVFHTLEGEGPTIGRPSVFLRLASCNLTCKGWATPENPDGCDTASSWKVHNKLTFEEIFQYYEEHEFHTFLKRGDVWKNTGGEPLLQQKALLEFTEEACFRWKLTNPDIEFETNATLMPLDAWTKDYYATFICSPKLSNNGDPEHLRYRTEVLEWHAQNRLSYFKFVICNEQDVEELFRCYIKPFNLSPSRIWLMPECATRDQHAARAPMVAELAKKHGFGFSTRLQVLIWNQVTGV